MVREPIPHQRLRISVGDITRWVGDAIVNAANPSLLGGGGVDGAIHRAAGPLLREECRRLGGCAPGEAKATKGYNLPAKWVIHTVGPVWRGGDQGEDDTLARSHWNSLELATSLGAQSVAFPAISTGAFGFPAPRAARIAVSTVARYLATHDVPRVVEFVLFTQELFAIWERALREWEENQ